jgi:hypothetical protein
MLLPAVQFVSLLVKVCANRVALVCNLQIKDALNGIFQVALDHFTEEEFRGEEKSC